jgi:hypothetical protein
MLIGLPYAAPKGGRGDIKRDRAAALKNTVNRREMPAFGTSRHFAAVQHFGRFRSEADIGPGL